ncbi:MAG: GNAT family N-acetyltransferase [Anaerolineae bacterium]|nr:GNAT family N-acetyltransferase [Anaerolineae bacterium]
MHHLTQTTTLWNTDLLAGRLVRLAAPSEDEKAAFARWSADPEYMRHLDDDPVRPMAAEQFNLPRREGAPNNVEFRIRTLADDKLIGFVALFNIKWSNGSAVLAIGIGEPDYRGKGYGSDALALAVGYAFRELNLHRVGLSVISYNARAIRTYEKVGFVREGMRREAIHRDGRRYDEVLMGILRTEWEQRRAQGEGQ